MITLIHVVQTSIACPSQWDAWDADGNYYYLRYRYGHGQVRQYRTADWVDAAEDELVGIVADFEHGHPLDGDIALEDFARLAGIAVSAHAMVSGYGDHLRDQLILEGVLHLKDLEEEGP